VLFLSYIFTTWHKQTPKATKSLPPLRPSTPVHWYSPKANLEASAAVPLWIPRTPLHSHPWPVQNSQGNAEHTIYPKRAPLAFPRDQPCGSGYTTLWSWWISSLAPSQSCTPSFSQTNSSHKSDDRHSRIWLHW